MERTTKIESTVTLTVSVLKETATETHHTTTKASITLSCDTKLADIAQFTTKAKKLIQTAKKGVKNGHYVFVDISRALFTVKYTDRVEVLTEKFEMWSGRNSDICNDGIHLTPSQQYNENLTHDLWITGKDILSELDI